MLDAGQLHLGIPLRVSWLFSGMFGNSEHPGGQGKRDAFFV